MSITPIDVLIIGSGMYVCGRGTEGYGTVLPAILQAKRDGLVGRVLVAATRHTSIKEVKDRGARLSHMLGAPAAIEGFPQNGEDAGAYKDALRQLGPRACVIIVVPDHLHFPIAKAVLESHYPVLLVKPFTATVEEGHQLVTMAEENNVYGAVEFHKRWDWANRQLQKIIADRKLGTPLYAAIEFSQRKRIPLEVFRDWAERTNVFQYLAVHYVDLIAHVFKATPQRAMAVAQSSYLVQQGLRTPDAIQAIVEWDLPHSDIPFSSTFLVNWIDPNSTSAMSYQSIKVVGSAGRFESDQKDRGQQLITDDQGIEDINPYFTQGYVGEGQASVQFDGYGIESIRTFMNDVRRLFDQEISLNALQAIRPTFQQALISTAVSQAVTESLERGGVWVSVPSLQRGHA
ncbi:MAG: Gfo/Idh/MocA family oxidoreductase [Nitrospirota bacterium]|nr:Gfo/Idh/MocA family oxidoreductase [Nitrospirota bacterium]